jgi:hypothetical protein
MTHYLDRRGRAGYWALLFAICFFGPALAQSKNTRTFVSSVYDNRVDACAAAKRDAQFWVSQETNQTPANVLIHGARTLEGYSNCDCGSSRRASGSGEDWKCSVDATIRSSK